MPVRLPVRGYLSTGQMARAARLPVDLVVGLARQPRSLDLGEIAEDVMREMPSARFRCPRAEARMEEGARPDVVDVGIELPDDTALLNSAMRVIFHAQDGLPPAIKVRRVLGERARTCANDGLHCAGRNVAAIAAAA